MTETVSVGTMCASLDGDGFRAIFRDYTLRNAVGAPPPASTRTGDGEHRGSRQGACGHGGWTPRGSVPVDLPARSLRSSGRASQGAQLMDGKDAHDSVVSGEVGGARAAVVAFFVPGRLIQCLGGAYPDVKAELRLDDASLGLALLGTVIAAVAIVGDTGFRRQHRED